MREKKENEYYMTTSSLLHSTKTHFIFFQDSLISSAFSVVGYNKVNGCSQ